MGIGPPSNRPSIICARKAQENTHNRIVSSTKKPLIQGVLKSWSTTQSTNIQTRLVSGAPEKHKQQHNRIVSSTRKAQQPDRFEHKKSTKNKHTNTLGFWSTRKAQKKHNRIVSSTRKAQQPDRFEHKKSTKKTHKHTNTLGFWSTRKAQTNTQSDYFEHKQSTNKKHTHAGDSPEACLDCRKSTGRAQQKNTIGSFRAQEKSTTAGSFRAREKHKKNTQTDKHAWFLEHKKSTKNTIGSLRAQAQQPDRFDHKQSKQKTQTYNHVCFLEHKKSTKKTHNRIISSTRKAQQKRGFCDRNLWPEHASQYERFGLSGPSSGVSEAGFRI